MKIPFTKMQGLGNDFMVIDGITYPPIQLTTDDIKKLADRHFGIGFDQLLWILPAKDPSADFFFRIFNADGSEVGQCGNGARCVARYIYDHLVRKDTLRLATKTTLVQTRIENNHQVSVDMGVPQWEGVLSVTLNDHRIEMARINLGNPHAVIIVDNIQNAPVESWGSVMQTHPRFPEGVNVGFMQIVNPQHILLRVYERGAGETLACGSGACAAVIAGYQQGQLDKEVSVELPGGRLRIRWENPQSAIRMTGPAEIVFTGECDLQYL